MCREHFIFWQQYKETEEAQRYLTFYQAKKAKNGQKTVSEWPYVAILDPRTGELMVTWQKLDATTFCDLVTEFLSLHPSLEPSHTVSLDWFLSSLEWILNFEFCLLKLLIFYQKLLCNYRSSSSTFWVFSPVFRYGWSKLKFFAQKMKNVEEISLNLIFH